jgi:hypothetical protein
VLPTQMTQFDGVLDSANCGVSLHVNTTSVQLQAYYTKAMNYTLMVTLLSFLQACAPAPLEGTTGGELRATQHRRAWRSGVVVCQANASVAALLASHPPQVVMLVKQMDYTNTQAGVAKVSLLTIGAQAIMDAYLCLLHLTLGIVMEQLFNAFATAAFFQFITFSLFGMRYV